MSSLVNIWISRRLSENKIRSTLFRTDSCEKTGSHHASVTLKIKLSFLPHMSNGVHTVLRYALLLRHKINISQKKKRNNRFFWFSMMQSLACSTRLSLFFLLFWSDEISVIIDVVLGVLVIPSDHHQTESNASCCGEQQSRSAQPRLCLRRGVGTLTRVSGSGSGGGSGGSCLFWFWLQHVWVTSTAKLEQKSTGICF